MIAILPGKRLSENDTERDLGYHISSVIRPSVFLPKQSQKARSVLLEGSRSLELFRKGKTGIIVKLRSTDLVICSHSRGRITPSYSQINTIILTAIMQGYSEVQIRIGLKTF